VSTATWKIYEFVYNIYIAAPLSICSSSKKMGSASASSQFIVILGWSFSIADQSVSPSLALASFVIVPV